MDRWLVVGHNAIAWDRPVLHRLGNDDGLLPQPVWDTLLFSWLLAPWEPVHALTGSARAHRAEDDAVAACTRTAELSRRKRSVFSRPQGAPSSRSARPGPTGGTSMSLLRFLPRCDTLMHHESALSRPVSTGLCPRRLESGFLSIIGGTDGR